MLVPAGVLTLLRLVQPGQAWAVQAVAFAPFALVGYAVATALLLPPLVHALQRDWRSWWLSSGLVVALTGALLHAWCALPRLVQIDHVLIGPSLTCLRSSRLVVPGTDHSALVTELAFR